MSASPRACPATPALSGPSCPERPGCPAGPAAAFLPRDGAERAVMLALRYVAAAAETGDAACFDAAFDGAEAAFGPRDGALLVARAAALVRALRREGNWDKGDRDGDDRGGDREGFAPRFLPPPCRALSPGEGRILALLRLRLSGGEGAGTAADGLSARAAAALADLAAPVRSAVLPPVPAVAAVSTLSALSAAARGGRGLDPRITVERRPER